MSVLWSQSPQLFARLFLLSVFSHQVLCLEGTKLCATSLSPHHLETTCSNENAPMIRSRRLGTRTWRESHLLGQGRTNRTGRKLVKNAFALALCSKSDFSAPFQSLLSVCHEQMTSVTCDAGQGQPPYGSHTLSSTGLPGPCLFQSLCVPCQTFIAHCHCVLSPVSSIAQQWTAAGPCPRCCSRCAVSKAPCPVLKLSANGRHVDDVIRNLVNVTVVLPECHLALTWLLFHFGWALLSVCSKTMLMGPSRAHRVATAGKKGHFFWV